MSYQSDDGKWSASFAPMVLSSFSQDWKGKAPGMDMESDVDLKRTDIDIALSYSINRFVRMFWGYKYQDMEIDFKLSYDTLMGSIKTNTK